MTLNGIDADLYMPPTPAKRKGKAGKPPAGALPLALLTKVDLDGQLNVGKLKANNIRVSNFKLTARGKDGKLLLFAHADYLPWTTELTRETSLSAGCWTMSASVTDSSAPRIARLISCQVPRT